MAESFENIVEEEDTMRGKFLSFLLGNDVFALPIRYVTEIVGIQPITGVPEVPAYVKGIINLRGRIIPVIDMRLKFGAKPIPYDGRTCIIVADVSGVLAGLIVDHVSEVVSIPDEDIVPPPDISADAKNRYISGIGKVGGEIRLVLDCGKLLNQAESVNMPSR